MAIIWQIILQSKSTFSVTFTPHRPMFIFWGEGHFSYSSYKGKVKHYAMKVYGGVDV
jgi:hypothetical protein